MGVHISKLVFQPPAVSYLHAEKHLIWLKTTSGVSIPGFFMDRGSNVTILFSHGNAEDIGMVYEWFREFTKVLKVNLFAYDYEGYGKALGEPSEKSCYEAIDAAYEYLTVRRRIHPERLVLYGRSLGSGPSCYLAQRLTSQDVVLGGLVLQSALLSVYRVAFNFRYSMWGDQFCNIDRIGSVSCPIFVIHGTRDEIVPFWNGEELFLAAPIQWRACPYWVEKAGHNDVELVQKEQGMFFRKFEAFLREHIPAYTLDSSGNSRNSGGSAGTTVTVGARSEGVEKPLSPRPATPSALMMHAGEERVEIEAPVVDAEAKPPVNTQEDMHVGISTASEDDAYAEGGQLEEEEAASTHGLLLKRRSAAAALTTFASPTRADVSAVVLPSSDIASCVSYMAAVSAAGDVEGDSGTDTSMDVSTSSFANLLVDDESVTGDFDEERSAGIVGHMTAAPAISPAEVQGEERGGGMSSDVALSPSAMCAKDIHGDEDVHDEFEELFVDHETVNTL